MGRYNDDLMFMLLTEIFAKQSHCTRLKVASLIVKDSRILSVGYNGSPPKMTNCDDIFSPEDMNSQDFKKKHHDWSDVNELHAEQNAVSWAAKQGINISGSTIYIKYSPCRHCSKIIIASGIKRLVYLHTYDREIDGLNMLEEAGVTLSEINTEEYKDFKKNIIGQIK